MPEFKKVAVVGASGLLGQPIVKQLAAAGFELTLISREPSKLKSIFPNIKAKYAHADPSDPKSIQEAFTGIEAVVSLTGTNVAAVQKPYVDAAAAVGVKRFIPSEFGCDTQAPYLAGELKFKDKRDIVAHLKELASAGKITYTVIITGLFLDNTLPYPIAGIDFHEAKASIPGTGNEPISLISRDDIGRYVVAILKHSDITENKVMHLAGDMQTANSLLAMYEKQLGKKFEVTYRSVEEIDRVAEEERKKGNMTVYLKSRVPYFLATGRIEINKPTEGWENKLDNDKFPEVKPETAEQIIGKLVN